MCCSHQNDRVEPVRVEEAKELIEILLDGTTFEGAEIFPVSGITGDGIPALRAHLRMLRPRYQTAAAPETSGSQSIAVSHCQVPA